MTNIPAWAIAQALREWRDEMPESTFRAEVEKQVAERAHEILARPPPAQPEAKLFPGDLQMIADIGFPKTAQRVAAVLAQHKAGSVLAEIAAERQRQDEKWGVQNHPDIPPDLAQPSLDDLCEYFCIPSEAVTKEACEFAFKYGRGSYADIFLEEVSEAIAAANNKARLREKLVQVAAVAVAWVEKIDRDQATGMEHAP